MITLSTKNGDIKFNLGTGFPREIVLCQTITKLQSKNSAATINITTSDKEKLSIKVSDIINFKFKEAEYIKAQVCTEFKGKATEQSEDDMIEQLLKGRNKYKKRKIKTFLSTLRKNNPKNIPIDPDDPMLQDIIDKL